MANCLLSSQTQAEEAPIEELDFFLFLADSYVKDNELITPLDLKDVEIDDSENATTETNTTEEASYE